MKQQQILKQQQRLLEEKQHQIEAQEKQIEELKDSLGQLKNRSSENSSCGRNRIAPFISPVPTLKKDREF